MISYYVVLSTWELGNIQVRHTIYLISGYQTHPNGECSVQRRNNHLEGYCTFGITTFHIHQATMSHNNAHPKAKWLTTPPDNANESFSQHHQLDQSLAMTASPQHHHQPRIQLDNNNNPETMDNHQYHHQRSPASLLTQSTKTSHQIKHHQPTFQSSHSKDHQTLSHRRTMVL